jgi:putative oxidoreductase
MTSDDLELTAPLITPLAAPLAALLATFIMLMAYLTAHYAWFPTLNNGELAAMYFTAFLVIFAFGPGPYSADSWLAIWRQKKRKDKMDKNKL